MLTELPGKPERLLRLATAAALCGSVLASCSRPSPPIESAPAATTAVESVVHLSPEALERFGVSTIIVPEKAEATTIVTTGEIKADDNRVFHINSLSGGRVVQDNVVLGDVISPGETLALVQNLEIAKIFGDYIHQAHDNELAIKLSQTRLALAQKTYERQKLLFDEKIGAQKDLLKAEADAQLEQATLSGMKEHATHIREEASSLLDAYGVKLPPDKTEHIPSSAPITTTRGGVIIKKTVTVGDVVNNVEPLYVVADLSQVWLDIVLYDKQVASVRSGAAVTFSSDAWPGRVIAGHVSYIKPASEDSSGTFCARAVLANPGLCLKPGMLGQVNIQTASGQTRPFVPQEALQTYGHEHFVFIDQGNGLFKKTPIVIAERIEGGYLVKTGVKPGDRIVAAGSFTLKAQMLKDTLAGEQ